MTNTIMKQIILTTLIFTLFGCKGEMEVYEREIKTYVISDIKVSGFDMYTIYFQTSTSTEYTTILRPHFDYKIGDTIHVLIKYWEKPKKK